MNRQSVVFNAFGVPEEVVQLASEPVSPPSPGEVVVAMEAAPINPADLNYIEGVYGVKPDLPGEAGLEGYGRIAATGEGVDGLAAGTPVIALAARGTWTSHLTCPAEAVLALPDGIDPLQAAMLKVNPLTAWRLLHEQGLPEKGSWVAQNAANSGVGQCVIQLAKAIGLKTLSLVRREEAIPPLEALGGDEVRLDDPSLKEATEVRPALAFNAVGGDSATRLMDLLGEGGKLITYGAMSRQALKVPNKFLLFKGISLHGLWVTQWLRKAPRGEIEEAYARLAGHLADGSLKMAVEKFYPLAEAAEAIKHAKQDKRDGKILLKMG